MNTEFGIIITSVFVAAVFLVLSLGLFNMMRGGSPERSQKLMQLRVLFQFIAIIVVLALLWFGFS